MELVWVRGFWCLQLCTDTAVKERREGRKEGGREGRLVDDGDDKEVFCMWFLDYSLVWIHHRLNFWTDERAFRATAQVECI